MIIKIELLQIQTVKQETLEYWHTYFPKITFQYTNHLQITPKGNYIN